MGAITLRQLVTHSACLPRTLAADDEGAVREVRTLRAAQLWAALPAVPLRGSLPCAPLYSNLGFALLGSLLAEHHGQPWEQLVRERIAEPLGMQDTVQTLDAAHRARMLPPFAATREAPLWDMDAYAGAGALRTTTADLLRFGRALLAGRSGPLGPAAERLLTPLGRFDGAGIGYGILIRGPATRRVYLHNGLTGAYRTLWMLMPEGEQVLVASASNARAELPALQGRLLAALFPVPSEVVAVTEASPAPPAVQAPFGAAVRGLVPGDPARWAGTYRGDEGMVFRVLVHEGRLYARGGPAGFAPLQSVGDGRFTSPQRGLLFAFTAPAGDGPPSLTVQQGGAERQARRTDAAVPGYTIPAARDVHDVLGRYQLGNGSVFRVYEEDGQLVVRLGGQPAFPVFARPGVHDRYFYEVVQAELQFERGAQGRVRSLVLHQNGEHRAQRTADAP